MKQSYGYPKGSRMQMAVYIAVLSALALLLATLQVTLLEEIRPFGAVPDLICVFVLCIAFFMGRYAGAITGIGAGFLIEAMGGSGLTLLPLFYLFLGYLAGYLARTVNPKRFTAYAPYLLATLAYNGAITLFDIVSSYHSFHLWRILIDVILPEAAVTALCGLLLYFPIKWICGRLEKLK